MAQFKKTPTNNSKNKMDDAIKQMLEKPIKLADQVVKACDEATWFKQECSELKSKTAKLSELLRQATRSSSELYERPTRLIIDDTEKHLLKTLTLALKCRPNGLIKRAFTVISVATFRKIFSLLDSSAVNVTWLLRVSAGTGAGAGGPAGLPPIAGNEPVLCLIWEQIAALSTGRAGAAGSLASLARDNDRNARLIIEEGGVGPLCNLLKDEASTVEERENAARAVGLLGRGPEHVGLMMQAGVYSVLEKILKDGPMKVQAMVAWTVSEFATNNPKSTDVFAQMNIVSLLVGHLAFETVEEHSKYVVFNRATTIDNAMLIAGGRGVEECERVVIGKKNSDLARLRAIVTSVHAHVNKGKINPAQVQPNNNDNIPEICNDLINVNGKLSVSRHQSLVRSKARERELEDPKVKASMKAMAARALWRLAKDNSFICRLICESRALLCFAVLLEKGEDEVRYNSAMALMEITAVAEKDAELRRSTFKPNSPACKAMVDQILRIIVEEEGDSNLLVPCVKAIGNLARTFKSTESRIIGPLVSLLDEKEPEVSREAVIALTKFAQSDNYLHVDHSKAIIASGGVKHLVQLVYFGERDLQITAVELLSYVALHAPDDQELAKCEVVSVLEWSSKQAHMMHSEFTEALLLDAKCRVELYQSRISG